MMEKNNEYNFEITEAQIKDLSAEQIHEIISEQIKILQPFIATQIDEQIHNAKDWREKFEGAIAYMNENYYNLHPAKIPLEKLEQVNRNLKRWKNMFELSDLSEIKEFTESTISSISEQIEFLKRNPTDPIEQIIVKMVPRINKDLFHHSTIEQWEDLVAGNYTNVNIEINQNAGLRNVMSVLDLIAKKINLDFDNNFPTYEVNKVFMYKGKVLTAKQMRDSRNKRFSDYAEKYFN